MRILYDLTDLERKILLILSKMEKEEDPPISLKSLAQELYPYADHVAKIAVLSRYLLKLEQLNLLESDKIGKEVFLTITDAGYRVIKEQIEQIE